MDEADQNELDQLVDSINAGRLTVFAGAGLSAAPPSALPSAAQVARDCVHEYSRDFGREPPADRVPDPNDLSQLASYFHEDGTLETIFLDRLVPWRKLLGATPNTGHAALADFLLCRAVRLVGTTNYDDLVERAAAHLGDTGFDAAVDARYLSRIHGHAPLYKLHGCARKNRSATLWCEEQLRETPFSEYIEYGAEVLQTTAQDSDLLFVGFWTDWSYLNTCLATLAYRSLLPNRIWIIDPASSADLAHRAETLWNWATTAPNQHKHLKCSGAEFLHHLRIRVSENVINRLLHNSAPDFLCRFGRPPAQTTICSSLDIAPLYQLRRSIAGVRPDDPVDNLAVTDASIPVGEALLFILEYDPYFAASQIQLCGMTVRLARGSGRPLRAIRDRYDDEPQDPELPEITICAGAQDDGGALQNITRPTTEDSVVKGTSGPTEWVTFTQFISMIEDLGDGN